jgi:hypothetical protein
MFTSYKTSQYRMHLYETLTGYKFVLLSDPGADSLRFVLRQLHTGPFIDYVVRNPLIEVDSRTKGIDNDQVSGKQTGAGTRSWITRLLCHFAYFALLSLPLTPSSATPSTAISARSQCSGREGVHAVECR